MKPTDDIHKLIKKLRIKASAKLDRRIYDDISRAMAESEPAVAGPTIWRVVTKGGVMKLAIAAAIFIVFGIGFFFGQWSKPTRLAPHLLDVTGYTSPMPTHPTVQQAKDGFWRQKALAAMRPRAYAQSRFDKISLLNAYKQYLKEKHL